MKIVALVSLLFCLSACGGGNLEVMKSPCAGAEGSPCGPKHPVNEWWMGQSATSIQV